MSYQVRKQRDRAPDRIAAALFARGYGEVKGKTARHRQFFPPHDDDGRRMPAGSIRSYRDEVGNIVHVTVNPICPEFHRVLLAPATVSVRLDKGGSIKDSVPVRQSIVDMLIEEGRAILAQRTETAATNQPRKMSDLRKADLSVIIQNHIPREMHPPNIMNSSKTRMLSVINKAIISGRYQYRPGDEHAPR